MTPQYLTESPPAQNPTSGKSVTIATKAAPELLQAVLQITERGAPYSNVSSFVRAAIHRLVVAMAEGTDSSLLPPIVVLLNEWSRNFFKFHTHEQVVAGMTNNARMLEVYLQHGDVEKATETLEDIARDILSLTDPFWKRVCLDEFWKFQAAKEAMRAVGDRGDFSIAAYEMWKEGQERQ